MLDSVPYWVGQNGQVLEQPTKIELKPSKIENSYLNHRQPTVEVFTGFQCPARYSSSTVYCSRVMKVKCMTEARPSEKNLKINKTCLFEYLIPSAQWRKAKQKHEVMVETRIEPAEDLDWYRNSRRWHRTIPPLDKNREEVRTSSNSFLYYRANGIYCFNGASVDHNEVKINSKKLKH